MKPIEGVDLSKCIAMAKDEVQADLEAQVVKQIKAQLMAVAQLKIKAANTASEANKLAQQLVSKEAIISKIESGDWSAIADSAKDRDEAANKADA